MIAGAPGEVTIVAHDIGSVRGGMERQLSELIVGLVALGHPVTVIARTCELPPGVQVDFHRVRGPGRPFLIAYPWFLLAGSLAVRRRRRGVVQATGAIVLNRVDSVAVHYCQQVGTATPSRDTLLFRAHIAMTGALKRIGERLSFRAGHARAFVCVSEGVAEEIREHYPQLADRVVTIYNGVDTDSFAPGLHEQSARALRRELAIEDGSLIAAFVGSEWERKGLAEVLRALAMAPGWVLMVAGAGDRDRYEELARTLGVGESVRWLGATGNVERVYALADAFVMASSYETFSLVTFEAAASGLPVVATAVNGVRELIVDGQNGFLVTADADVIAERLRRLAGDPQLRSRLGEAARQAALGFSRTRMIEEHEALFEWLATAARG
ncbi:MAG TPA: glycosyltransferase family 4 protein [Solirubrobacteraceae bacterium]|jgi:UDP-glucose:(heptosyl)LPS alpha-1,3-glucosyltransferase|nr:glycosyltransferase family 4 protein [Solirubrobacteraceae bacterium]